MRGGDEVRARGAAGGSAAGPSAVPVVLFRAENPTSLAMTRTLGRMGVPVHAVDCDSDALAWRSRYCTRAVASEAVRVPDEAAVQWLCDYAARFDDKPVLLPTFDTRNLLVDAHRQRLSQHYLLPQPRAGAVARLYSKRDMHALCIEHGIPTPRTVFPMDLQQALEQAEWIGYPVVLKGIDSDRLQRHCGKRLVVVENQEALRRLWALCDEPGVANLAMQQFIPGGAQDTWAMTAYFDSRQECRFAMSGHKLREWPLDGGACTRGITRPCEPLLEPLSRLARVVGFHGALDADFRYDATDGRYRLLDVNPRVGANFRAWADANGHDVVRAMYLDLTQQPIPQVVPAWGRVWVNELHDFQACLAQWRLGAQGLPRGLNDLRRAKEYALLSWDDLVPALVIPRVTTRALTRRLLRGLHARRGRARR